MSMKPQGLSRSVHEAGINITRKTIWHDRQMVLEGLKDDDLKKWLEAWEVGKVGILECAYARDSGILNLSYSSADIDH